jgi:hypothetical protein
MPSREQEAASIETAALRLEAAEQAAEQRFDAVFDAAERDGAVEEVTATAEFRDWMSARHATDEAWGRWAVCMGL